MTPDAIDLAGYAYVITEYDDLIPLLDELPSHAEKAAEARDKRDRLLGYWRQYRDLPMGVDALADARYYREIHPHTIRAYLARVGQD